ncbi:MAG TPA: NFACT RNA binding domain-containing protein [Halanaerobiales bacterium]|nr:NFACT RNA binding domain-containing protein [Halanaerobiales bacterium]
MSIDGILLSAINTNLKDKLQGGRIDKIYQPFKHTLTFTVRNNNQNYKLLISSDSREARIQITNFSFDNPQYPPDFCMLLRKYLMRGIIKDISQPDFERILKIEVESYNKIYYIFIEIMGRYNNIILTNDNLLVLDAATRLAKDNKRNIYPTSYYEFPPGQGKLNPLRVDRNTFFEQIPSDFNKKAYQAIMYNFRGIGPASSKEIAYRANMDYNSKYDELTKEQKDDLLNSFKNIFKKVKSNQYNPSIGIKEGEIDYYSAFTLSYKDEIDKVINFKDTDLLFDYYYENYLKDIELKEKKKKLKGIVNNYLKKNNKKQSEFREDLKKNKNYELFKQKGELIKANLHQIEKGQKEISLTNYYDSNQKEITIDLDPKKAPIDNAQKYFKKYQKAKKSLKHLKRQIGKLRHEEKYLNQVLFNIDDAINLDELKEIEAELREEGYIKKQKQKNDKRNKEIKPYKYTTEDNYQVLIGRNNKQNDKLTKYIANEGDIWLHTKKIAGSHVIIRNHNNKEVPESTIIEAARLAAYFSKAKESTNVPIDYTPVENVNKPKGAKPGLVYYDNYNTVYVDPAEKEVIEKIEK